MRSPASHGGSRSWSAHPAIEERLEARGFTGCGRDAEPSAIAVGSALTARPIPGRVPRIGCITRPDD